MTRRQKDVTFIKGLLQIARKLKTWLMVVLFANIRVARQGLNQLGRFFATRRQVLFVLLLFLIFGLFILAAILPSPHIFEGDLIVKEMSFTYSGQQPKLFLSSVQSLSKLEIEGTQMVTFTGKFESGSTPQLNQLKKLTVKLNNPQSKLIIAAGDQKQPSEVDLTELRLEPNTTVEGLSYDLYRHSLAFTLQPQLKPGDKPGALHLDLGEQLLKVTLENYELPDIKLANQPELLDFTLNPENKELELEIKQRNQITLTKPTIIKSDAFQGRIETKNVKFLRLERTGDIGDDLPVSTIIEGKIRMVDQERELKPNQFLMGGKPNTPLNIELIRNLQIMPKQGLEVRFSGKTQAIKIGLDQDFPVSSIQGSWLDGVLPRDAIIALFSFGAATITYLLSFVIENSSKSKH